MRAVLSRTSELLERTEALAAVGGWEIEIPSMAVAITPEAFRITDLDPARPPSLEEGLALFDPEARATLEDALQRAIAEGVSFELKLPMTTARGRSVWVYIHGLTEKRDGRTVRLFGIVQDISAHQRAEAELRVAKAHLQATLDVSPDLLFEMGPDGRFFACHWGRRDLLFVPQEEFVGRLAPEVLPAESAAVLMAAIQEAAQLGYSNGRQMPLELQGSRSWFELSVAKKASVQGEEPRLVVISRDITTRKQAEATLLVNDLAFRVISQGVVVAGPDQLILSVNAAFENITGYSLADAKGRNCRFLQGPLTDPATAARIRDALASGREFSGEVLNYRKDGVTFWNELTISPAHDAEGTLTHYIGVTRDVTTRRLAEQARRESELQLSLVIRGGDLGFWDWDTVTGALEVNDRWLSMLGLDPQGPRPTIAFWHSLIHPDDLPKLERLAVDVIMNPAGRDLEVEIRARHQSGRYIWVLDKASVVERSADGSPLRVVGTHLEITARKEAEEALRLSEQRFRTMFENEPECVKVLGVNGDLLEMNAAGLAMLEADSVEQVRAKGIASFIAPGHLKAFMALQENATLGQTGLLEFEVQGLRGGHRWLETRVAPLREADGSVTRLLGVTRDITERRQSAGFLATLEEQLRESQKTQAIGTLASGIAHDFNNIIAIILGNADVARHEVSRAPVAVESLDEIVRAASRARELVRQILSFARREPMRRERRDVRSIVDESVSLLRATLPSGLTIEAHCPAPVRSAWVDAVQVEQVIINLATNAAQSLRGKPGHIDIRLEELHLDETLVRAVPALLPMLSRGEGPVLRLSVTDDGPGMDAVTLSRVFEPFFTTKSVGEGTGLGLSVVHGIARGHEGVVTAVSQPGGGATFALYLPLEAGAGAGEHAGDLDLESAAPGTGAHVLYVDDTESLLRVTKRLLETRGYRVTAHTRPHEAIDALRGDPGAFDLVLTDYNMPLKSGLELAREIRAIRADLPVALLSGFVDEGLRAQAEAAGVRDVVLKATLADLYAVVKRLTSERVRGR